VTRDQDCSAYELHKRESHGFSASVSHVWITKYRYKVLEGALRERIRTMTRQMCEDLGVQIVSGVLSREHVHMFVEIPPHIAVSDFVRRVKGRSSHRVHMEFPELRKRYWGRHFWTRGYHHERQHHGRCHTSVSSGTRTYRRQPVGIQ
jgi:REP element-mobilizing transposase RayT